MKIFFLYSRLIKYCIAIFKLAFFFGVTFALLPFYFITKFFKCLLPENLDFFIRSVWSKFGLWLCKVRVEVNGSVYHGADVFVCNHVSWLDILVLQSILKISFVAKAEVKEWPVFGFLAKIADTVFIERRAVAAKSQQIDLVKALKDGKRLCLFPEGTSTNGSYILPFKSSLFEVFVTFNKTNNSAIFVQPVSLVYSHSDIEKPSIFGWWGDMNLIGHIFEVVANTSSGKVEITFYKPLNAKKIGNRKKLATVTESVIKKKFENHL